MIASSGNTIHVVWGEYSVSNYDSDIFYTKSLNKGDSFEPFRILSNPRSGSAVASITVNLNNVFIIGNYYNYNTHNRENILIQSTDGGNTFTTTPIIINSISGSANTIYVDTTSNLYFTLGGTSQNGYPDIFFGYEKKTNLELNSITSKKASATFTVNCNLYEKDTKMPLSGQEINFIGSTGLASIPFPAITTTEGRCSSTATTGPDEGIYSIQATFEGSPGYDSSNKLNTFVIDNTVPEVRITKPSSNSIFKSFSSISITANAQDRLFSTSTTYDGIINKVEFWYKKNTASDYTLIRTDTVAPYGAKITGLAEGTYNLIARAYDEAGNRKTSSTVNFKIDNTVPEVRITSPANGATFTAPATITVTADAKDKLFSTSTTYDGKVTKVELLYKKSTATDYTLIRTDTLAPYDAKVSSLSAGDYNFIARAYDESGNRKTSSTITVRVR